MNGWSVLGIVLIVLLLMGQVKVGVGAEYGQEGLSVRAKVGLLKIKVFPRPKKAKKEKKPKGKKKSNPGAAPGRQAVSPQKPEQKKPEEQPKGGKLELAKAFLPLAVEAAGCFWRRLTVDELELCLTVGGPDPADAAMLYGQANAALAALWQPLTQAFHVKDGRTQIRIDFDAQSVTLYGRAALSLKLGQIIHLGIYFGWKALMRFLQYRKQEKAKQQHRKAV